MSSAFATFLSKVIPSNDIFASQQKYSVEELQAMTIFQRLAVNDWRLEFITLSFITVFVFLFAIGDWYNKRLVVSYLESLRGAFEKNFYQYGVSPKDLYIKDNSESYASYATGRNNIAKVNITIKLKPRHNLFVWVLETVLSFFASSVQLPEDKVDFVITPARSAEYDNFIAAIVSKLGMNEHRKFNYFLSLTKTSDSTNLPESFVYMSEANEFQEKITTPELKKALTLQAASFIKYIAVTDQPVEKPESIQEFLPQRKIIFSTSLVSNSAQLQQIGQILDALFSVVDKLASKEISFKPEALKKVVKTRESEISKIQKIREEIKQEELAAEKAKLRREERDKLRTLSREEQIKAEKKAQEKKQRKQLKKNKVRM
ncbi:uncharacterized protein RJT20DRAFT_130509 [Scheffersomyces xylosifermentans]|uniref:uncharacterized protein n=1 Tax=Scheffersomyces xylosifermentans TaxID=1304137 RepID=UPI00315CFA02